MYRAKEKIWVLLLFFSMIVLTGCDKKEEEMVVFEEVNLKEGSEIAESGNMEEIETIFIHVCGQVVSPGVYEMDADSRVYEAIHMAGGMTEVAAKDFVNQAEPLTDGQKVYIPSAEEVVQGEVSWETVLPAGESEKKVNINIASKEELMTLSGIGEKRAEAILAYRQANGAFGNAEELMQVEGISQGTYEKIKDQITVL